MRSREVISLCSFAFITVMSERPPTRCGALVERTLDAMEGGGPRRGTRQGWGRWRTGQGWGRWSPLLEYKINQTLTNYLLEDDRDPSVSLQSQAR